MMYVMYSIFETACLAVAGFHIQHELGNQAKPGKRCPDKMCWSPRNAHIQKTKAIGAALEKSLLSCGLTTCTIRD